MGRSRPLRADTRRTHRITTETVDTRVIFVIETLENIVELNRIHTQLSMRYDVILLQVYFSATDRRIAPPGVIHEDHIGTAHSTD